MSINDIPTLRVGDAGVDGARITPYVGVWKQKTLDANVGRYREQATITEEVERVELEGKEVLRRTQTIEAAQVHVQSFLFFDAETLAPLKNEVHINRGGTEMSSSAVYDWATNTIESRPPGETTPVKTQLDLPMFEGGMIGLIIKAMPLEEGFIAKIPVYLQNQNSKWWMTARVVGSEMVDPGDGEEVDTWVVEADWVDMENDDHVYQGGGSGGVYYIIKNPPEGAAHVAKVITEAQPRSFLWIGMEDGLEQ